MKPIIKIAFLNAMLTFLYVAVIATFMFYAPTLFGKERNDTVLVPIVMLSLLVFSAALTGALIFGRPALWYVDGKKKEAILLLAYTLGIFFIITIIAVCALYFST
ncbi:MAG: hypothetical protein AAB602_03550 [Patescibacteria group bacterium]